MTIEEKIAKLESEIQNARTLKQQCSLLNDLAMELRHSDSAAALTAAQKALAIAEEINFTPGKGRANFCIGLIEFHHSEYEKSYILLNRAYNFFLESSDHWGISNALNNLGLIHMRLGDYTKALENFSSSLQIKKETSDRFGISNVMMSMAAIHREAGKLPEAQTMLTESLKIAEELKSDDLVSKVLTKLGTVFFLEKDYENAQEKFNEAKTIFERQKNLPGISLCFLYLGRIKAALGQLPTAISFFEEGQQMALQSGDKNLVTQFLTVRANECLRSNQITKAISLLQEAKQIAISTQEKPMLATISQSLSETFEATGELKEALGEFKNFIQLKEEINAAEVMNRMRNHEISARVESLEKENQMLEMEKMAALGQLTAGVAHEINNPVNFIASNISPVKKNIADILLLLEQYETALKNTPANEVLKKLRESLEIDFAINETDELLKGIESGAHRIREIVNALRVITRLDEESFKVADVHEEIDSVLLMLQTQSGNNTTIKKEYGEVDSFEHFPALLSQALMNILRNAIEATSDGGTITVKTLETDNSIHITISDSGKGMSEKVKRKIFDPFFTTKDVGAGFGLGLSVARSIVEQHHGTIDLESEPGKGTVVKMILPARK